MFLFLFSRQRQRDGYCILHIPKDVQYLVVRQDTITLAKQTFFYNLQKMCQPVTRQRMRRGNPRKKPKNRDSCGKFIAGKDASLGDFLGEPSNGGQSNGGSETGSHVPSEANHDGLSS